MTATAGGSASTAPADAGRRSPSPRRGALHAARVARQAPGRFRGNVCAVFEDGLAGLIGIGESGSVDVHHDLIALAGRSRIDAVVKGGLREERERVSLLFGERGRFRGTHHVAIATPRPH